MIYRIRATVKLLTPICLTNLDYTNFSIAFQVVIIGTFYSTIQAPG